MKKVYFKKLTDFEDTAAVSQAAYELLERLVRDERFSLPQKMPLKVHFGERGNVTFIKPQNFDGIKRFLKEQGVSTCYIETNVLYKGSRTHTDEHIKTALEHGFGDLDIIIADGSKSDSAYNEIEINKKHFSNCKIGKRFEEFEGFVVLAHFKGHGLAGFGGAIKQLAMGFASRGGKLAQHSDNVPVVSKNKCIACGICAQRCPVNAISIDGIAKINPKLCIGCAACSAVCPKGAVSNDWKTGNFHEKLAEYAYAATLNKKNIYINFVGNITKDCDCMGIHMEKIAENIGILASTDPVAIDMAALNLLNKLRNIKLFETGLKTLEYGESIGLGRTEYKLEEL